MVLSGQTNINKKHAVAATLCAIAFCFATVNPLAAAQKPAPSVKPAEAGIQADDGQKLRKPAMIIRFNNPEVNFQDSLKKLVDAVSARKTGTTYYIQSVIPDASSNVGDSYRNYNKNLRLLVSALGDLGVPIEQVKIDITSSTSVPEHEIRIFVR